MWSSGDDSEAEDSPAARRSVPAPSEDSWGALARERSRSRSEGEDGAPDELRGANSPSTASIESISSSEERRELQRGRLGKDVKRPTAPPAPPVPAGVLIGELRPPPPPPARDRPVAKPDEQQQLRRPSREDTMFAALGGDHSTTEEEGPPERAIRARRGEKDTVLGAEERSPEDDASILGGDAEADGEGPAADVVVLPSEKVEDDGSASPQSPPAEASASIDFSPGDESAGPQERGSSATPSQKLRNAVKKNMGGGSKLTALVKTASTKSSPTANVGTKAKAARSKSSSASSSKSMRSGAPSSAAASSALGKARSKLKAARAFRGGGAEQKEVSAGGVGVKSSVAVAAVESDARTTNVAGESRGPGGASEALDAREPAPKDGGDTSVRTSEADEAAREQNAKDIQPSRSTRRSSSSSATGSAVPDFPPAKVAPASVLSSLVSAPATDAAEPAVVGSRSSSKRSSGSSSSSTSERVRRFFAKLFSRTKEKKSSAAHAAESRDRNRRSASVPSLQRSATSLGASLGRKKSQVHPNPDTCTFAEVEEDSSDVAAASGRILRGAMTVEDLLQHLIVTGGGLNLSRSDGRGQIVPASGSGRGARGLLREDTVQVEEDVGGAPGASVDRAAASRTSDSQAALLLRTASTFEEPGVVGNSVIAREVETALELQDNVCLESAAGGRSETIRWSARKPPVKATGTRAFEQEGGLVVSPSSAAAPIVALASARSWESVQLEKSEAVLRDPPRQANDQFSAEPSRDEQAEACVRDKQEEAPAPALPGRKRSLSVSRCAKAGDVVEILPVEEGSWEQDHSQGFQPAVSGTGDTGGPGLPEAHHEEEGTTRQTQEAAKHEDHWSDRKQGEEPSAGRSVEPDGHGHEYLADSSTLPPTSCAQLVAEKTAHQVVDAATTTTAATPFTRRDQEREHAVKEVGTTRNRDPQQELLQQKMQQLKMEQEQRAEALRKRRAEEREVLVYKQTLDETTRKRQAKSSLLTMLEDIKASYVYDERREEQDSKDFFNYINHVCDVDQLGTTVGVLGQEDRITTKNPVGVVGGTMGTPASAGNMDTEILDRFCRVTYTTNNLLATTKMFHRR